MVMMTRVLLGELVAGEAVLRSDPPDQPRGLELGEVPVRRALREVAARQHLGDRERVAGRLEAVDDGPAPARVALARVPQAVRHHLVHVVTAHPVNLPFENP